MDLESLRQRLPAAALIAGLAATALAGCSHTEPIVTPTDGPVQNNTQHISYDLIDGAAIFPTPKMEKQCAETAQEQTVVPDKTQDLAGGRILLIMKKSTLRLASNNCPRTVYTSTK